MNLRGPPFPLQVSGLEMQMKNRRFPFGTVLLVSTFFPAVAYANVQSILVRVQTQLQAIIPLVAAVAIVVAAFYFFAGDAQTRPRVVRIIIGIVIGLAAVQIVSFLQGMVR